MAGTRVSLDPPTGFVTAQQFPGFQVPGSGVSIMVTELPGPARIMIQGMTREALASRGMTLIAASTLPVDGIESRLLHVRQASPAGEVLKWMLIGGDDSRTIMIVGTYPAGQASLGAQIRASLSTARFGLDKTTPDPFEGLTFRIIPTGGLKVAGLVGNVLTLTETGRMTPGQPDAALYFVGHSLAEAEVRDLAEFSRTRVRQTTRTRDIGNEAGRPVSMGDLRAYELQADAVDTSTGRPVRIYQVIAPDADGYFIVQAFVTPERAQKMIEIFRAITGSFQQVR